jgi:hypothetical protein
VAITESALVQTAAAIRQTQDKAKNVDQLRLFIIKHEYLKISVDLQIAFTAENNNNIVSRAIPVTDCEEP